METLVGILVLATPVAIVMALFAGLDRREQRRRRETERQIALTDAIHARLGAVAAPVVRLGAHGLAHRGGRAVRAAGGGRRRAGDRARGRSDRASYEVVLSRQTLAVPAAKRLAGRRARRGVAVMDMNEYADREMVRGRLADLRAAPSSRGWPGSAHRPRRPRARRAGPGADPARHAGRSVPRTARSRRAPPDRPLATARRATPGGLSPRPRRAGARGMFHPHEPAPDGERGRDRRWRRRLQHCLPPGPARPARRRRARARKRRRRHHQQGGRRHPLAVPDRDRDPLLAGSHRRLRALRRRVRRRHRLPEDRLPVPDLRRRGPAPAIASAWRCSGGSASTSARSRRPRRRRSCPRCAWTTSSRRCGARPTAWPGRPRSPTASPGARASWALASSRAWT